MNNNIIIYDNVDEFVETMNLLQEQYNITDCCIYKTVTCINCGECMNHEPVDLHPKSIPEISWTKQQITIGLFFMILFVIISLILSQTLGGGL